MGGSPSGYMENHSSVSHTCSDVPVHVNWNHLVALASIILNKVVHFLYEDDLYELTTETDKKSLGQRAY
jgi:hypothetical protein